MTKHYIKAPDRDDNQWLKQGQLLLDQANLICLTKEEYKTSGHNPLIWFGTNFGQYLSTQGSSEVCTFYGKHINNADDFAYQLCHTIPWGFEMGRSLNAIYDVLLNFTTMPANRYFIWQDAQHLFRNNKEFFELAFELLIVASYLNTNGLATHDYKVNQRVIFLFDDTSEDDVAGLLNRSYHTPSIFCENISEAEKYKIHRQEILIVE